MDVKLEQLKRLFLEMAKDQKKTIVVELKTITTRHATTYCRGYIGNLENGAVVFVDTSTAQPEARWYMYQKVNDFTGTLAGKETHVSTLRGLVVRVFEELETPLFNLNKKGK